MLTNKSLCLLSDLDFIHSLGLSATIIAIVVFHFPSVSFNIHIFNVFQVTSQGSSQECYAWVIGPKNKYTSADSQQYHELPGEHPSALWAFCSPGNGFMCTDFIWTSSG